jgi:hypothetical protein
MKKIIFILLLIPLIMVGQNFNFKKFDTTNIYDKIRFDSTILANRIYQDSLLLSDKVDSVWVDLDSLRVIDNGIYSVYPLATVPTILRDTMYRNIDSIIHINNNGLKSFIIDDDTCIISGTRSQLLALRTANALKSSCAYIITDHVQGRLVAGTQIRLTAVSTNEFSENVSVNTTYDNEAWRGIYDIDRALVLELQDNRNNIARGFNGAEVSNFDWGNTSYTNCLIDNSSFTTTYGATRTINNLKVLGSSTFNNTGQTAGTLTNIEINNSSSLTLTSANITLNNTLIKDQSSISAPSYTAGGTLTNYRIYNSTINLSNSTSRISISSVTMYGSTITHSGVTTGTITGSNLIMENGASIIHNNGANNLSLNRVALKNQSTINHSTGVISLSNYELNGQSTITQNTVTTANISLSSGIMNGQSNINNSSAININGTRFQMDRAGVISCQNGATGTITLTNTKIDNAGSINILSSATAGNSSITSSLIDGASFIQKQGTGVINISNLDMKSSARVLLLGTKNLNLSRVTMNNVANITSNSTAVGISDAITDCSLFDRSNISFTATGGNSMLYNTLYGIGGSMNMTGTTNGFTLQQCVADNGAFSIVNNTVSNSLTLSHSINGSTITITGMTVTKSMNYFIAENNSSITINNPTGAGSHSYLSAINNSNITVSGASTSSNRLMAMNGGGINQNGGSSTNVTKQMANTLTTGNFNHSNIIMISPTSRTLTGANTSRSEYLGVVSSTPLF